MIRQLFSYVIKIFESVIRDKIGYVSAFIIIIGSFAVIFLMLKRSDRLDGLIRSGRKFSDPISGWFKEHPVFGKTGVPIAIFLVLFALWIGSRFDFISGFLLCALVMAWFIFKYHDHSRGFMFISVVIIFLFLAPYIFEGQDIHVKVFDSLDAILPQQKILAESGHAFSFNPAATIDRYMNGLPLSGFLNSGFNVITVLYMIFTPFTAYTLNMFFMAFFAFFGMYYFLKDFVISGEEHRWIVIGAALCFSLLPFYPPAGISIAGLPLLFYCFLKLKVDEGKARHYIYILFFSFYSTLSHAGIFILIYLGVLFLADIIKKKKFNLHYFSGLGILVLGYLFTHFHIIYSFLDPGFVSYREEIKVIPLSTGTCLKETIDNFIFDKTNAYMAQQVFVIFSAALAVLMSVFRKVEEIGKILLFLLLILFNAFLWGFKYWVGVASLRENFQLLNALNLGRFFWLNPFLWYIVFALALLVISRLKHGKTVVLILLIGQLLFLFSGYNWEYRDMLGQKNHLSSTLTYREFYSEKLFKKIDKFIAKPQKDYRIVCLGIHPGIANYNGFYTLDVYSNIYPLEYKHKFRRIMEKELEKCKDLVRVFDENGKRCYLLSAELHNDKRRGLTFARGITKNQQNLKVRNLELNTAVFAEMGGEYIFSAVKILNNRENGLSFEGVFEENDSPWRIHLYKVAQAESKGDG
jgi:hypothetical protein